MRSSAPPPQRSLANIRVEQAAAENLPFPEASFDFVLCRFSAHHWHHFEAGLREARRVLCPEGRAVFIDTVAPADPLLDSHLQTFELLRDPSHVRNYDAAEWVAALARSGFAVEAATPRKLRMDFSTWIARTGASAQAAEAVRQVQLSAPPMVTQHFAIEPDGSFQLETLTVVARPD